MIEDKRGEDSAAYQQRRAFFRQMLTIYGRKPVLEALQIPNVRLYRLHLADSNRTDKTVSEIIKLAEGQGAEILYHNKRELSRISKNGKQDQGVAADLICPGFRSYHDFLSESAGSDFELLALDRITNPQNLGMIIRSASASGIAGILLPEKGSARLDPLVIKASAGTLFRAPILLCDSLPKALADFRQQGAEIYALKGDARSTLSDIPDRGRRIYVMGNETEGVSSEVGGCCNRDVAIPMANGVESLNVAVAASLLAFRHLLRR